MQCWLQHWHCQGQYLLLAPHCLPCCCLSFDAACATLFTMIVYSAVVCPLVQLACVTFSQHCPSSLAYSAWHTWHTWHIWHGKLSTWRMQGGTSSLAYLAWNPDAAEDIGVLVAVAPVVYATYLISPTLVAFSRQANVRELKIV